MLSKYTQRLLKPDAIIAASLVLNGTEEPVISAIVLSLKKGKIEVGQQFMDIVDGVSGLTKLVEKKWPVVLVVSGKGLLWRKINDSSDEDETSQIQRILPGVQAKNIYTQKTNSAENEVFVSILRNEIVDHQVSLFAKEGLQVVSVSLGPFSIAGIVNLFQSEQHKELISIDCGEAKLNFRNGLLIDAIPANLSPNDLAIDIMGSRIYARLLSSFAAGVIYLSASDEIFGLKIPAIAENEREVINTNLFKKMITGSLAFFFMVLLINFLVFDSQYKKKQILEQQFQSNQSSIELYGKLKSKYENTADFLSKQGWLFKSHSSFFSDKLAATIPPEVQLTDLSIFPLREKRNGYADSIYVFNDKIISVSGRVQKSMALNEWMGKLKIMDWVKDVKIDSYQQENQNTAGLFSLTIQLK